MNTREKRLTFLVAGFMASLTVAGCKTPGTPNDIATKAERSVSELAVPNVPPPSVNPNLAEYVERFSEPQLIAISDSVLMAFGYDYANFYFVIGDDGIAVVDCGWWPDGMSRALSDLRTVSDLPITHVLFTHSHADHVGGCVAIPEIDTLSVIASTKHEQARVDVITPAFSFTARRAVDQMGFLLEGGQAGDIGVGVGPRRTGGRPGYTRANKTVSDGDVLTINGVEIQILDAPSDVADAIALWFPKEGVLLPGDVLGGVGPYVATPRHEETRDPEAFISTLDTLAKLPIEAIGPGHGRAYVDKEDIARTMGDTRDAIQYIIDHIVRGLNAGKLREEILAELSLPPHLEASDDLGFYYHPLDWVARGVYLRLAGWYGNDPAELFIQDPRLRSKKLLEAMGGADGALRTALSAAEQGDWNWAGELAAQIVRVEPENSEARQLLINAMRAVGYQAESSSQRYYLLTGAKALEGSLDRSKTPPLGDPISLLATAAPMKSLQMLRPRLEVERTLSVSQQLNVRVPGRGAYLLHINRGVLRVKDSPAVDAPWLEVPHSLLPALTMGFLSIDDALSNGSLTASDQEAVLSFWSYLE